MKKFVNNAANFVPIEITKSWEAKRGKQSFTGERSIGTPDPGIVAVATMMHAIAKVFDKEKV